MGSASTAETTPAGYEQEPDLADPGVERLPEAAHVAPGGETRQRREEDGGDGDREDPLWEHVEAKRKVDCARSELGVDQPRCERHAR